MPSDRALSQEERAAEDRRYGFRACWAGGRCRKPLGHGGDHIPPDRDEFGKWTLFPWEDESGYGTRVAGDPPDGPVEVVEAEYADLLEGALSAATARPALKDAREEMVTAAREAIIASDDVIGIGEEPFTGWSLILAERAVDAALASLGEAEGGR